MNQALKLLAEAKKQPIAVTTASVKKHDYIAMSSW
jgi:hypothetical protein